MDVLTQAYSHTVQAADEKAAQILDEILTPKKQKFCNQTPVRHLRAILSKYPSQVKTPQTFNLRGFPYQAPPRFELGNKGFADLCLTTWLWRRMGQITTNSEH